MKFFECFIVCGPRLKMVRKSDSDSVVMQWGSSGLMAMSQSGGMEVKTIDDLVRANLDHDDWVIKKEADTEANLILSMEFLTNQLNVLMGRLQELQGKKKKEGKK